MLKGKHKLFRELYLLVCLLLSLTAHGQALCPILPTPSSYVTTDGKLEVEKMLFIQEDGIPESVRNYLIKKFTRELHVRVVFTSAADQVVFKKKYNVPKDAYSIRIDRTIHINYSSEASCFYAITSLFQLMETTEDKLFFQKCFVSDAPKYEWRAMRLDVCSHFFTAAEVKRFIEWLAQYKYNVFQWQLMDQEVCRMELKKYPNLAQNINGDAKVKVDKSHYTHEELKDILSFAAERFITVVPEISLMGNHLWTKESVNLTTNEIKDHPVQSSDTVNDSSFYGMTVILDEVLGLFPSQFIHIGAAYDTFSEGHLIENEFNPCVQLNAHGKEHEKMELVNKIGNYISAKGRVCLVWDACPERMLTKKMRVVAQNPMEDGLRTAGQGYYTMLSPRDFCSFEAYQSNDPLEPPASPWVVPMEKVYSFDPKPEGTPPNVLAYVLGGQGNLSTEYLTDMRTLEYMAFPRMIALAQALWCENKPSFQTFQLVFSRFHIKRLQEQGVNYAKTMFYPEIEFFKNKHNLGLVFKSEFQNNFLECITFDQFGHKIEANDVLPSDTLFLARTSGKKVNKITCQIKPSLADRTFSYEFTLHPALGLNIDLMTQPMADYAAKGSFILTNGKRGNREKKDDEWLGFDTTWIEMGVDLGSKMHFTGFQIGCLIDTLSNIDVPDQIVVLVTKNDRKWKEIGRFTGREFIDGNIIGNLSVETQFVKIILVKETRKSVFPSRSIPSKTFIDELILYLEP